MEVGGRSVRGGEGRGGGGGGGGQAGWAKGQGSAAFCGADLR